LPLVQAATGLTGILSGLANAPPNPAILSRPQYQMQQRSGQVGKGNVKPQEAKQPPQQPPQVQAQQSASAAEE